MAYLFAAFSVVWTGLFIYLIFLATRQKKLLEEIKILKDSMTKEESENPKSSIPARPMAGGRNPK